MRAWRFSGLLLLVAGCAGHRPPPAVTPPAPALQMPEPRPPAGSAPNLIIPKTDDAGRFITINRHIGSNEALWHVRSALNVAALSCGRAPDIVANYNRFLRNNKAALARAYRSEAGDATARDRHMTQLYNFFAQPPVQPEFCKVAQAEAARAVTVDSAGLMTYAPDALARLEKPITDFYHAYATYQDDLAAWRRDPHQRMAAAAPSPAAPPPAAAPPTSGWRIQIGAFTGKDAALAAWTRAQHDAPGLTQYAPRFEPVPGRTDLVRVQVGSANDRDGALKLCAIAAAGGFDCIPVPAG